jgi:hypothetical protein
LKPLPNRSTRTPRRGAGGRCTFLSG